MNSYNLTDEFPVLTFIDFENNDERDFYTTYAITPYDHWLTDEEMVDTIDRIVSELNKKIFGDKAQTFLTFYAELFDRFQVYEIVMENYKEQLTNNNYTVVLHIDKGIFIERCKNSLRGNPLMRIIIPELHLLIEDLHDLTSLLHFSKSHTIENLNLIKEIFERHGLYNLKWGEKDITIENTILNYLKK